MSRITLRANLIPFVLALSISAASGQPPAGKPDSKTGVTEPANSAQKATASGVIQIKRQITGDLAYRFVPITEKAGATAMAPVPLPGPVGGENVVIAIPSTVDAKTHVLEILDNGRGNIARMPISTASVANLAESSFSLAQRISVPVRSNGAGVVGAQVTMTSADKKYMQTRLLQPDDGGIARFDSVPLNQPVTVTVSYAGNPPESQTKTLTVTRGPEAWPAVAVTWPDAKTVAPTLSAAPTAAVNPNAHQSEAGRRLSDDDNRPSRQSESSPLNALVSTVISLLFLAAVGYGVFHLYKTGKLKIALDRLGINTEPIAVTSGGIPDPFAKQRTPIQPITEGTADPFSGGMSTAGITVAPIADGPRLIATSGAYSGNIFPLNTPSADIGRDTGNAVSLPNDTNTSRRHATIQNSGGQFTLVDNGSSNGTFVNGVRVAAQTPQSLRAGDEIQIGMTRFRFEA